MDPTELALRDVHLPAAVSWWPLAPGWWLLIAIALGGIAWLLRRWLQRRRFNAARRYALREFANIEQRFRDHGDAVALGKSLSQLLRRTMLAYAARGEVAGLTGEHWLQWLDRDMPVPYFHTEGGKSLLELPYRNPHDDASHIDLNALIAAVRMRLATPVGGLR